MEMVHNLMQLAGLTMTLSTQPTKRLVRTAHESLFSVNDLDPSLLNKIYGNVL